MKIMQLDDEGNKWHLTSQTIDKTFEKTDEYHLFKEIENILVQIHNGVKK